MSYIDLTPVINVLDRNRYYNRQTDYLSVESIKKVKLKYPFSSTNKVPQ